MSAFELPEGALPRCLFCDDPVQPSRLALAEVIGYTRPRAAGGANHIIARRETGRVVCPSCAVSVTAGTPPRAEALF